MRLNVKSTLILLLILGVYGCTGKTNEEMLVNKKWELIGIHVEPKLRGTNDLLDLLDDCHKDDVEIFYDDGRYVWDKGDVPCDAEMDEGQLTEGKWAFTDKQSQIITLTYENSFYNESDNGEIIVSEDKKDLEIVELSDTTLKVRYTEKQGDKVYTFVDSYITK